MRKTLLHCQLGNHKGHFTVTRFGGAFACQECIRLASRQFVGVAIAEQAQAATAAGRQS